MGDDDGKRGQAEKERRVPTRRYMMPSAVVLLGVLAAAMLVWMKMINERQHARFALADALMEIQTDTATAHFELEETLAGYPGADMGEVRSVLAHAVGLSEAILRGTESVGGLAPQRLQDRDRELLALAEKVGRLLSEFVALSERRYSGQKGGEERFHQVFREIQATAKALENAAEKKLTDDRTESARLFAGIFIAWSLAVVASAAGLWSRESRRKRAEDALRSAHDGLEVRVAERTRELKDLSEQLSRELAEKTVLQQEAERAAHLASLGELAAGVAHEINNPANGIINCAEILMNKSKEGSREHDIGRRIIKEGDRIAYIVQSLLSFSREDNEAKSAFPVGRILEDTLALTEAQVKREGIALEMDVPGDGLTVQVQPQRIEQVFLNIINNARYALNQKYTGKAEGKKLSISARQEIIDGRPHARVVFRDQGTGIPAHVMSKVMNPFFSTKPKGKGTGLGLSISHGIVVNHGGTLTIDSVEGAFTEVAVALPLTEVA